MEQEINTVRKYKTKPYYALNTIKRLGAPKPMPVAQGGAASKKSR